MRNKQTIIIDYIHIAIITQPNMYQFTSQLLQIHFHFYYTDDHMGFIKYWIKSIDLRIIIISCVIYL